MFKNKSTAILVASAVILFVGVVSFVYATVNVGDNFNFQSAYQILNASSSSILGGLSVGTSTLQTPGNVYTTGNITSLGSLVGSLSAVNVSSGIFGSTAGKGNYTFQAAANANPVLYVDATNERIGIGMASPSEKLQVNGAIRTTGALATASDGTWGALDYGSSGVAGRVRLLAFGDASTVGSFQFYQAKSGNAAPNVPMVIDTSGNVGIATTTPGSPLTVAGVVYSSTGGFKFPDATIQTTAASGVPSGTVIFYDGAACPSGWAEFTSARGRVVVGLPSGGTLDGTLGTALTDLQVPVHSHDLPIGVQDSNFRIMTYTGSPTGAGLATTWWGLSTGANIGYTSYLQLKSYENTSTTIPYIQLLVCKKT